MTRISLIIVAIFCFITSFGQINQMFPNVLDEVKGNPMKITSFHHDGGFPNSWKVTYEYQNKKLVKRTSRFKRIIGFQKRGEYFLEYDTINHKSVITEFFDKKKNEFHSEERISDSTGKVVSCNIFFHKKHIEERELAIAIKNINYNANTQIISYDRNLFRKDTLEGGNQRYLLFYDSNSRLIRLEINDMYVTKDPYKDPNDTNIWRFKEVEIDQPILLQSLEYNYNSSNQIISMTIREHGPIQENSVFSTEPIVYSFEYDPKGNWITKWLKIGDNPKELSETRKIKYKN